MRKREDTRGSGGGDEKKKRGRREEGSREREKKEEGKSERKKAEGVRVNCTGDALACKRACEHYSRVGTHSLRRIII